MSYTKARFVEQVLLKVGGGILTDEMAIQRVDIKSYLPAAINYVQFGSYNINLKTEGTRDINSLFYAYFPDIAIQVDSTRHNWTYIPYPKAFVALPHNQGVRQIEDGDGNTYKPLSDNGFRTIKHSAELFTGASYYRPEKIGIYLFSQNKLVETVSLSGIVDVDDLADTDILPIPAGFEKQAIDVCYEFFVGERELPADRKNDKTDVN